MRWAAGTRWSTGRRRRGGRCRRRERHLPPTRGWKLLLREHPQLIPPPGGDDRRCAVSQGFTDNEFQEALRHRLNDATAGDRYERCPRPHAGADRTALAHARRRGLPGRSSSRGSTRRASAVNRCGSVTSTICGRCMSVTERDRRWCCSAIPTWCRPGPVGPGRAIRSRRISATLLYGRGAADMKGGVARSSSRWSASRANIPSHRGRVALLLTRTKRASRSMACARSLMYSASAGSASTGASRASRRRRRRSATCCAWAAGVRFPRR